MRRVAGGDPPEAEHLPALECLDAAIRENFEVYKSVGGWDPSTGEYVGRVLFTGYFTPIYHANLTRSVPYQFPLYKRPADLVTDPVTETSGRRDPATGNIGPHLSRAEIERDGKLAGQEYVWLADRFVRPMHEGLRQLIDRAQARGLVPAIPAASLHYIMLGAAGLLFSQAPECRHIMGIDPSDEAFVEAHADAVIRLLLDR